MFCKLKKFNRQFASIYVAIFSLLLASTCFAKEYLSPEEIERWFNSDDELPINKVNEGDLTFLAEKSKDNLFYSSITIFITQNSIQTGWVNISQCYKNLDKIQKTVIVFRKNLIKNIAVTSLKNIDKSSVLDQHKLVLLNVKEDAELCLNATVRNFYQNEDQSFSMVNGPYHRKFLDGYYPYHLNLNIHFPKTLQFLNSLPKSQVGFQITQNTNKLSVNSIFEGRLKTNFRFKLKTAID